MKEQEKLPRREGLFVDLFFFYWMESPRVATRGEADMHAEALLCEKVTSEG